jgi:hypothetical protein
MQVTLKDFGMSQNGAFVSNCASDRRWARQCAGAKLLSQGLLYLLELGGAHRFTVEILPNLDDQIAFVTGTPTSRNHLVFPEAAITTCATLL